MHTTGGFARSDAGSTPVAALWRSLQVHLRGLLALAFGLIGLFAATGTALFASQGVYDQLRLDTGAEFASAAERVADLLDRGLHERLQDIRIAAGSETLRQVDASPAARRDMLRRIRETYPDYALLLDIGADGRVLATDRGLYEGMDVSRQDYFRAGLHDLYLGDMHDAPLMDMNGRAREGEPARFLDLAAPVRDEAGQTRGVIAAHLHVGWAESVGRGVMRPLISRHPGALALVLDTEGRVVIGPRDRRGLRPPGLWEAVRPALERGPGSRVLSLPEGEQLIGFARLRGEPGVDGLGWSVVVLRDAAAAFAPAEALRRRLLLIGVLAAVLAGLAGWVLAHVIARPLEHLSQAALRLRAQPEAVLPPPGPLREAASLRDALATLHASLRQRERELLEGEARLRAVLEQMPAGVALAERSSGRLTYCNARAAETLRRAAPAAEGVEDCLRRGGSHEDGTPLAPHEYPLAQVMRSGCPAGPATIRYQQEGAAASWLAVSAAPIRIGDEAFSLAVCTFEDITEMRAAAERQRLLAQEVDHRARNALAVVQATLRLSRAGGLAEFRHALEGRVSALARAQSRLAEAGWKSIEFGRLLREESEAAARGVPDLCGRLELSGPHIPLAAEIAQPLSLVVHELTLNAVQHGALSGAEGRVTVEWRLDSETGMLRLRWQEWGGPVIYGAPPRPGFGLRLVEATLRNQMGGGTELLWRREGLVFNVMLPTARILSREVSTAA